MDGGSGSSQDLRRALDTLRAIAEDRSTTVVPVAGGEAFLNADFPAAHDLNRLVITAPCQPTEVADAADDVLGGAGLCHRLITVPAPALGHYLADELSARGYESSHELVMAATRPAERRLPPLDVVRLDLTERVAVASAGWRQQQPDWDDDVVNQLGRRVATVLPAAQTTFLAVRGHDGSVAARADLYVRDGVAQVEEVWTDPDRRGQGLASLLVARAVEQAHANGAELVFLVTDADDWPQQLYCRLGFTDIGRTMSFHKTEAQPRQDLSEC